MLRVFQQSNESNSRSLPVNNATVNQLRTTENADIAESIIENPVLQTASEQRHELDDELIEITLDESSIIWDLRQLFDLEEIQQEPSPYPKGDNSEIPNRSINEVSPIHGAGCPNDNESNNNNNSVIYQQRNQNNVTDANKRSNTCLKSLTRVVYDSDQVKDLLFSGPPKPKEPANNNSSVYNRQMKEKLTDSPNQQHHVPQPNYLDEPIRYDPGQRFPNERPSRRRSRYRSRYRRRYSSSTSTSSSSSSSCSCSQRRRRRKSCSNRCCYRNTNCCHSNNQCTPDHNRCCLQQQQQQQNQQQNQQPQKPYPFNFAGNQINKSNSDLITNRELINNQTSINYPNSVNPYLFYPPMAYNHNMIDMMEMQAMTASSPPSSSSQYPNMYYMPTAQYQQQPLTSQQLQQQPPPAAQLAQTPLSHPPPPNPPVEVDMSDIINRINMLNSSISNNLNSNPDNQRQCELQQHTSYHHHKSPFQY